jgi:hypothetical protein
VVYALTDLLFGTVVLPRATGYPQALDLGWDLANTLLGMAGALAAARPLASAAARAKQRSVAPRVIAVLVGLAGLIALVVRRLTAGQFNLEDVLLPVAGGTSSRRASRIRCSRIAATRTPSRARWNARRKRC